MNYVTQAWAFLQGKKTYIIAAIAILNAVLTSSSAEQALPMILAALGAAALRHGVATS